MDNPLNSVEAGVAAGGEEGARLPREKTPINDFILGMPSCTISPVLFLNIGVKKLLQILYDLKKKGMLQHQGGRSWQPFGQGKNGHQNFRQMRIYFFRNKYVDFA